LRCDIRSYKWKRDTEKEDGTNSASQNGTVWIIPTEASSASSTRHSVTCPVAHSEGANVDKD